MSGHSKWANIKHRKGAQDKRRGKVFTRVIKEITIAAKQGLADPDANPRLRLAIQNAKGANIPKDTIQRAIDKGSGKDSATYSELTYEGYGPSGIAVFVECATDNLNRTVQDVRSVFNKSGGNLGTNGSLSFVFEHLGIFEIPKGNLNADDFEMEMIEAGAEDMVFEEGYFTVTTAMENFGAMMKKLEAMKIEPESAQLQRIPKDTSKVDLETAKKVMRLVEMFEEDDDIQAVYHNLEMTDELMDSL